MKKKRGIKVSAGTICAITGIIISLIVLAPVFKQYTSKPGHGDYHALNNHLQPEYKNGDYVLFEPKWLRGFARDFSRLQFIPDYSDNIFERGLVERIWYVSSTNKPPKTSLILNEKSSTEIGRLKITLYEVDRKHPLLIELFDKTTASIGDVKGSFNGERIVFEGLDEWTTLYPTTEYFHGDAHNGVFYHPVTDKIKRLKLNDLPPGTFYFTYGLRQRFDCNPEGQVHVTVQSMGDVFVDDSMTVKKGGVGRKQINLREEKNSIVIEATTSDDKCMHFYINGYHAK